MGEDKATKFRKLGLDDVFWHTWAVAAEAELTTKDLWEYFDPDDPLSVCPLKETTTTLSATPTSPSAATSATSSPKAPTSSLTTTTSPNPDYAAWRKGARKAKAELVRLVTERFYHLSNDATTPLQLWNALKDANTSTTATSIGDLMTKLAELRYDSVESGSLSTHLDKFFGLITRIQNAGENLPLALARHYMLQSVCVPELDVDITLLRHDVKRDPSITLESLRSSLLDAETARKRGLKTKNEASPNEVTALLVARIGALDKEVRALRAAQPAHGNRQNQPQSTTSTSTTKHCSHCKKNGHTFDDCWTRPGATAKRGQNSNRWKTRALHAGWTPPLGEDSEREPHSSYGVVDSGANRHLFQSRSSFTEYSTLSPPIHIHLADNRTIHAVGIGSVSFTTQFNSTGQLNQLVLPNVLHVPELLGNLISCSELAKSPNVTIHILRDRLEVNRGSEVIAIAPKRDGLYIMTVNAVTTASSINKSITLALVSRVSVDASTLHRRFGHFHISGLQQLQRKRLVFGLPKTTLPDSLICESCLLGKSSRKPFPKVHSQPKKTTLLGRIHSDVMGPIQTKSVGGARFVVTFIDEASGLPRLYFMAHKSDVFTHFKTYKTQVELETGEKIKILRTDGGGEYCSTEMKTFLAASGIIHETTSPYSPQQNGVAERMNRTITEMARTCLIESKFPGKYWADAMAYAAYTITFCPNRTLNNQVPRQIWTKRTPNTDHLRPFGCDAYVHILPHSTQNKFAPKAIKCALLGYCEHSKAYRLLHRQTGKVYKSRDVDFIENPSLNAVPTTPLDVFSPLEPSETAHIPAPILPGPTLTTPPQNADTPSQPSLSKASESDQEEEEPETEQQEEQGELHENAPPAVEQDIQIEVQPQPRRSTRTVKPVERYIASLANPPSVLWDCDEPLLQNALAGPEASEWKTAMALELETLTQTGTYKVTDLPPGRKPITCKWVLKRKRGADGTVERFKARLVARGFTQVDGLDYQETFAPVVKFNTIRTLFAIATELGLTVYHADVTAAFLNGNLEETIYMTQPPLFDDGTQKVWQLLRALYGLKQASRAWYAELHKAFTQIGFTRTHADHSLWFYKRDDTIIIIPVYVDDFLGATNKHTVWLEVLHKLQERFKVKDLGEAKYCLGIQVTRDQKSGEYQLGQRQYFEEVLKRFGMSGCNPVDTPLPAGVQYSTSMSPTSAHDIAEMKTRPYLSVIGSLMYGMLATRPDLAHAVGVLSRFSTNPGKLHWQGVKRVLRYIKGTLDKRITYRRTGKISLLGYCDADWGTDPDTHRSIAGYIFTLAGSPISWSSKRQPTVALSTMEAEYMASTHAAKEAIWLRQLLTDLQLPPDGPTTLLCDNKAAISLAKDSTLHARAKHIAIRHHFIRERIESGEIEIRHCQSSAQCADFLTKSLSRKKLRNCLELLNF